jgi:molybdopterin synthase catalytic subunit
VSAPTPEAGGTLRLVGIRDTPLSVDEVLDAVRTDAAGGLVVFVGTVRETDGGRDVSGLGYSAHPSAEQQLRDVAASVAARFPVVALAAVHRVGDLAVGDLAVVVAAACPHRSEAFDAARALIDELKAGVPIWKHQVFSDGGEEWVGSP